MNVRSERMKIAKSKGTHTVEEWTEMKKFFGECVICYGESGLKNIEKDHIIPIYQGGSDSIKNIQPVCAKCNCKKGPERIDHRVTFCESNNLILPKKWIE